MAMLSIMLNFSPKIRFGIVMVIKKLFISS